jgi:hypothetical protein
MASAEFESIFARLRSILQKHADTFSVTDKPGNYCLSGNVGRAALAASKGKMKQREMPIAWVNISKAYVSYHLMGIYMNPKLQKSISKELKTRMQGKSCFNFKSSDEALFDELEQVTARSIEDFRKAGFIPA